MVAKKFTVSRRLVEFIVTAMGSAGVDTEPLRECLDDAPGGLFGNLETRIPRSLYLEIWQEAEAQIGSDSLGLQVADAIPFGARDASDYLLRSAPTLGDALRLAARLARLFDDAMTPQFVEGGDVAQLQSTLAPGAGSTPALNDYLLARVFKTTRHLANECLIPNAAYLNRPVPANAAEHEAFYKCAVVFEHPINAVMFPSEWLSRPMPQADPGLNAVLQSNVDDALARLPRALSWAAQVSKRISDSLTTKRVPSQNAVARGFGMTARTLRRQLAAEETSYQDLLDRERSRIAQDRISTVGDSPDAIAEELGFQSTSAFFRAFKRWTGMTPREWLSSRVTS
jgi:AraC-like DNA-binding protein